MPKPLAALQRRYLILVSLLLLGGGPVRAAPAGAYTVGSILDQPDAAPGNNVCADSNGACTLRVAVMEANAHAGPDTIMLPAETFHLTRQGGYEDAADT